MRRLLFALSLALSLAVRPTVAETVREPAVAGLFYPRDPAALAKVVDGYLAAAKTERTGELKALICPHAGYPFSGPVAASGFRLLRGTKYHTVFVLGPSHYALLNAASVSGADAFLTPLGAVPISPKARLLGRNRPFAIDPRCTVERPGWAAESSRRVPAGTDRADTWEHADEVEVPFLQRTLPPFELVPVVMGDVDPAAAARALSPYLDDTTLLVVSSDLSHYHPYAEARRLDEDCVNAICALDIRRMSSEEACGRIPILTLLHLAKERGWRPQRLDFRNSGDTSGDRSRVVGYTAIAFYAPRKDQGPETRDQGPETEDQRPGTKEQAKGIESQGPSAADRALLLKLARQSVIEAARSGRLPSLPTEGLEPELTVPKGVFVTLTKHGDLRGCIGHIVPQLPLVRAVAENARSAAIRDPRFPPVRPAEVDQLEIEISVLTNPEPLTFSSPDDLLAKLKPNVDGVVLQIPAGGATYLPQVWEQLPDKVEFLDTLAEKAGGRAGDWRKPGATVAIYHVISFKESER